MSIKRIKAIHMPPRESKYLNEHEQIILNEHGVLYYDKESLIITANKVCVRAMEYVDEKNKIEKIYEQIPTAIN